MPSFGQVALPDINPLFDLASVDKNINTINGGRLENQGAQQNLTDRSTLRGLAPGLATRDPNALAGAAVLPGGAGAVNSLSGSDATQAQIMAERAKLLMLQPDTGGPPVGGAAPAPTAPTDGSAPPLMGPASVSADPQTQQDVGAEAQAQGVSPGWAMRVHYAESGASKTPFGPGTTSPAGAIGPMQLMPDTAKGLGVDPNSYSGNIKGGVTYLGQMKARYVSPVLATAAYNAGPQRVDDFLAGKGTLPPETVAYVGKVFGTDGASILNDALSGAHGHVIPGNQTAAAAPSAQPGVTLAPDGSTATPAPGPQTASRGPIPGQSATDVVPGGAPVAPPPGFDANGQPLPAGAWDASPAAPVTAPTGHGVSDVMARLRNTATPAIQNPNALLSVAAPDGSAPPAPPNALAGPAVAAAPTPVPGAAAPAPAAPQPVPASPGAIGEAPPGAVMLRQPITHLPWPGAQPGNAFFKLPDGSVQQFNDPSQPQPLTHSDSGTVRTFFNKTGQPVSTQAIPGTGRETLVDLGDGRHQMEKDGALIGPIFPASTREFTIKMAGKDQDLMPALSQQALEQEQTLQKTIEARNTAAGLPTGSNFESRQATSNWVKTYFPSVANVMGVGADGNFLPDPGKAAEAAKLLTGAAQQNEKAMGGSGGLGITQMFVNNNPNLNMQPAAIRDMSNLNAVTALATKDYLQGKINHIDANTQNLQQPDGTYKPSSAFDKAWFSQNNTLTYYAAVQAMNGKPWDAWSKGLSDDDKARALGVIARIDPTATVTGRNGHPLAVSGFKPADPANPSGVAAQ